LKVLVYEWVVGGGPLDQQPPPPASLRREGLAMLEALVSDFARIPGAAVSTIVDTQTSFDLPSPHEVVRVTSLAERDRALTRLARSVEGVALIAPEQHGILLRLVGEVERIGGKLISPGADFVGITSDKHETAIRLFASGVMVPEGMVLMPGEMMPASFPFPGVLKPIDGVGSVGIDRIDAPRKVPKEAGAYRLERFVAGTPASVAVVCGPRGMQPLAACRQLLGGEGGFHYQGGSLPLSPPLAERAQKLAVSAVAALPPTVGWVGVDMVLGDEEEGDRVIEINPRMTTSYVGLRAATEGNIAEFLWRHVAGEPVDVPEFVHPVLFRPDGSVERAEARGAE
jgi:predicted ATP-grasp superfamily ATP-dependent carboligase